VAPLWIALIFVAAVSGFCMFIDGLAKRRRNGLANLNGSANKSTPDAVSEVDRVDPGAAARADLPRTDWGGSSWS
jgi:hypothetical protein